MPEQKRRYRLEVVFAELTSLRAIPVQLIAEAQLASSKRQSRPRQIHLASGLVTEPYRRHSRDDRVATSMYGCSSLCHQRCRSSLREPRSSQRRSSTRRKSCNRNWLRSGSQCEGHRSRRFVSLPSHLPSIQAAREIFLRPRETINCCEIVIL
jgi:hypothetical protein